MKLQNSVKLCFEGMNVAVKNDADAKDPNHAREKVFMWQVKSTLWEYSDDFAKLHTSLIYRLGVASRDASADRELDHVLSRDIQSPFDCWSVQSIGAYFYKLGTDLKAKGN